MYNAANNASSQLAQAIGAEDTSLTVVDASNFPEPPFVVSIEDEIIEVGAKSGNTFSALVRGAEGTIAAAHPSGTMVENRFTAGTYTQIVGNLNRIEGNIDYHANRTDNPHGVTAAQVGAAPSSHVGAGGSAHALATTSAAGFMSAADKTKLNAIEVETWMTYADTVIMESPGQVQGSTYRDENDNVRPTTYGKKIFRVMQPGFYRVTGEFRSAHIAIFIDGIQVSSATRSSTSFGRVTLDLTASARSGSHIAVSIWNYYTPTFSDYTEYGYARNVAICGEPTTKPPQGVISSISNATTPY